METSALSHFLFLLGRTSAEAAVLVFLVLAAGWVFRRQLTPGWRCALWLIVAVRLLLPFSFGSATSIFNLLPRTTQLGPTGPIPTWPTASEKNVTRIPFLPPVGVDKPGVNRKPQVADRQVSVANPLTADSRFKWTWSACLFAIWLAGVLVLARHVAVSSARLWRRKTPLSPTCHARVTPVLQECCTRLQLRHPPAVFESAEAGSPALYGLFRPCLLLPKGFAAQFSSTEMRFVFLHELAHLKRRDLLVNWLMVVLQVLHWFNPLIWFGFSRWRAERELACDAMALEAADEGQNKEYGRTILRLLDRFSRPKAAGLVGILEDKRQLHRRIGMIASFVPRQGWPQLAIILIGFLAAVGLTDARSKTTLPVNAVSTPAALPASSPPAAPPTNASHVNDQPTVSETITSQKKGSDMFNATMTNRLATVVTAGVLALASPVTSADGQPADHLPQAAAPDAADDLTGAWVLVGTPDHVGKAPSAGGRIKLFTGTHWCISQAEPKTGVVFFHHGGTYTVAGDTFHANLEFANPSTMELIGKTNGNYTYKIEGDTLTSLGTDNPWKEVWKRLKPRGTIDSPLAKSLTGTWVYAGKPGETGTLDTNRIKFYAGGYWCYTTKDPKTGVVIAHHGGYYSFEDGAFIESCQYSNPVGMELIGHDLEYKIKVEGDVLTLTGVNNPFTEVWKRLD